VPRIAIVILGVGLLAATVYGIALSRASDDPPPAELTVAWGGSEGHPSCVYDAEDHAVTAKLNVDGEAPRRADVTVTVTAYADENTSQPVGSGSRTVQVEGAVHLSLLVTMPVEGAPHVDEDGETACRLSVEY
jgi:hypothetical protein